LKFDNYQSVVSPVNNVRMNSKSKPAFVFFVM